MLEDNLKLKNIRAGRMTATGLRYFEAEVRTRKKGRQPRVGSFCFPSQSTEVLEKLALDLKYLTPDEAVHNHDE